MKPKTNQTNYRNILVLLIPTFVLIVAWIGFTIYGNRVKSTISDVQNKRITPISPTFDFATITSLQSRDQISPIFTFQAPPSEDSSTPSPTAATDSAELLPPNQPLPTDEPPLSTSESATLQEPTTGGTQ